MSIHLGFEPDADRARALDRRMYSELAGSLAHVCEQSRGAVPFDGEALDRLVRDLGRGVRYEPVAFGHYYRLVAALLGDDHEEAGRRFALLAESLPLPDGQRVRPLGPPESSERDALYQALMGPPDAATPVLPPSDAVAAAFETRYREGMALMERALPDLADEVGAIVHEVVPVVGDPGRETRFDGGSHFQLWGALFLNADSQRTPWDIVEVVAHESAHSLLFAFCTELPLVYNDDDELHPSPLRHDPRPMDGIYHATFVSARMHWAMSRLLDSGELPVEARDAVAEARDRDAANFESGVGVIDERGQLSDLGAGLLEGAREHVLSARG